MTQEQDVVRLQEQVKTLFAAQKDLSVDLERHEQEDKQAFAEVLKRMDEMYKTFQNRPPVWASTLIAALMGICGWLAK